MKTRSYAVPTRVLVDQGRTLLRDLEQPAAQKRLAALESFGIPASYVADLKAEIDRLEKTEADQERAKADYTREAREDRAVAEEGYRYKLALDGRARAFIALHGDELDLAGRFRFGKLRAARARGVVYELRIVLPEVEAQKDSLAEVGIDDALIARGWDILSRLGAEKAESAQARATREELTRAVRESELATSRLFDQLLAADEAFALANAEDGQLFRLDVIRAEQGRVDAARAARVAARPGSSAARLEDE